jgi:hypothetical protein
MVKLLFVIGDRNAKKDNEIEAKKRDCETILLFILSLCRGSCRFSVGEGEPSATSLSNSTALRAADGPALLVATVGVFVVSVR